MHDIEFYILEYLNGALKDESKSVLKKWYGIDGIKNILKNIQTKIEEMESGTLKEQ